jgi:SAM-dependent methyltransferase
MSVKFKASDYWNAEAESFDSIYREDGSVNGWLNRLLRGDMEGRYRFALSAANPGAHPHILEIGCGTGVHTRGFLDAGAASVTGIDVSSEMLKIASGRLAGKYDDRVRLVEGDFREVQFGRTFDVVTAIGVFDYIADSLEFMKKAAALTAGCFIATFPRAGTLRSYLRKARLSLKGCPVYFYTKERLEFLAQSCGTGVERCAVIGQLFCAVFKKINS